LAAAAGFGDPYLIYWDGSSNDTAVTYLVDTWYLVTLEFDTDADQYNFVVYDTDLNEIVREDDISFGNAVTIINEIKFVTGTALIMDGHIDDFRLRQFSSPEPSATLGSEEAIPSAPTIGTPTALSSTSIRWNFTDNANNETGFRVYDNTDAIATSSATANLTYLDETGLLENTQYSGRYVKAYNTYGNSTSSLTASAIYTLADTPTSFTATKPENDKMNLSVGAFSNDTVGSSGYYFYRSGDEAAYNSGWIQTNSWQDTDFECNTHYTWYVKYRNSDGTETSTTSVTSEDYPYACGGGGLPGAAYMPPISPPPTLENPEGGFKVLINDDAEITNSRNITLKLFAGSDTERMVISSDPDFAPEANTADMIILKGTEQKVSVEEMTKKEILIKMIEILKNLIQLYTQFVQILKN